MTIAFTIMTALWLITLCLTLRLNNLNDRKERELKWQEQRYFNDISDIALLRPEEYKISKSVGAVNIYAKKLYGVDLDGHKAVVPTKKTGVLVASFPYLPADDHAEAYAMNLAEDTLRLLECSCEPQPEYPNKETKRQRNKEIRGQ